MTKTSLITALSVFLLCFGSSSTGQKNETEKEPDTTKPVVIVTKQNLPVVIDSLKQPLIEKQEDYKAKIDSIQRLSNQEKKPSNPQKKNKTKTKIVYRDRVIVDTVYVEKKTFFQKIGNIFKSKKSKQNGVN